MSFAQGYFGGGDSGGTVVKTTDKVTYSNDTTLAQTSANLSQIRFGVTGVSDTTDGKGYFVGGFSTTTPAVVATADKLTYSNNITIAQSTANITTPTGFTTSVSDNKDGKGYFAGGLTTSVTIVGTAYKLTYSNDTTVTQTSANLSSLRQGVGGVSDDTDGKGYFAGGVTANGSTSVTTTDKITYSNDTTLAKTSANLSIGHSQLASISDNTDGKGYCIGGLTNYNASTATVVADKITYSTDSTAAITTANISTATGYIAGISDNTDGKGYIAGGFTGASTAVKITSKITYSNDTTVVQTSANLSTVRYAEGGVSGNEAIPLAPNTSTYFMLLGMG